MITGSVLQRASHLRSRGAFPRTRSTLFRHISERRSGRCRRQRSSSPVQSRRTDALQRLVQRL